MRGDSWQAICIAFSAVPPFFQVRGSELYHDFRARVDKLLNDESNLDSVDADLLHQNRNLVKLLTSAPEEPPWCP